jgi:malate dehydrogenase
MTEAILHDRNLVVPCSAYLQGEYGLQDIFFGVPVVLNRTGMSRIIEYRLSQDEQALLDKSAAAVKETHAALKKLVKM